MQIETYAGSRLNKESLLLQVKQICIEASGKEFKSEQEKENFCTKWIGPYIKNFPEFFYLLYKIENEQVRLSTYLCICPDSLKFETLFNDLNYYSLFRESYDNFPAHLHINTASPFRSQGHGSKLLQHAEQDLAKKNIKGLHLITASDARNTAFYFSNHYQAEQEVLLNNKKLLLLGKRLIKSEF